MLNGHVQISVLRNINIIKRPKSGIPLLERQHGYQKDYKNYTETQAITLGTMGQGSIFGEYNILLKKKYSGKLPPLDFIITCTSDGGCKILSIEYHVRFSFIKVNVFVEAILDCGFAEDYQILG